jgi:hypothetical protein
MSKSHLPAMDHTLPDGTVISFPEGELCATVEGHNGVYLRPGTRLTDKGRRVLELGRGGIGVDEAFDQAEREFPKEQD